MNFRKYKYLSFFLFFYFLVISCDSSRDFDSNDQKSTQSQPTQSPPTPDPEKVNALILKGAEAYNNESLGDIYQRSDEAIKYFTEALKIDPQNAAALHYRGDAGNNFSMYKDADIARQRLEQAIADFSESVRIFPDDATTYHLRADTYRMLIFRYRSDPAKVEYWTEKHFADWDNTCRFGGECTNSSPDLASESRRKYPNGCITHYTLLSESRCRSH